MCEISQDTELLSEFVSLYCHYFSFYLYKGIPVRYAKELLLYKFFSFYFVGRRRGRFFFF